VESNEFIRPGITLSQTPLAAMQRDIPWTLMFATAL